MERKLFQLLSLIIITAAFASCSSVSRDTASVEKDSSESYTRQKADRR